MSTTLLLDLDIVVYRAGFSAEKRVWYGLEGDVIYEAPTKKQLLELGSFTEIWQEGRAEPVENALHNCNTVMSSIMGAVKHDNVEGYLTGKDNFRKEVATIVGYKANREDKPKPVHYEAIRTHLQHRWNANVVDGMEADDMLGIRATEIQQEGGTAVIASIDKDLLMIPAIHYNWIHDKFVTITEEDGWYNFYMQCLTGDRTDNIPGIEGIGNVYAAKILEGVPVKHMEKAVRIAWKEAYPNGYVAWDGTVMDVDSVVDEIKELLWIRRSRDE